jgi:hypothetical protein
LVAAIDFSFHSLFSISVRLPSDILINNPRTNRLILYTAAALIIAAGLMRFFAQPSFWLDEAVVADPLRETGPGGVFAPLKYGQLFPRTYLAIITTIRELFGYQTWSLRLLPFLSFVVATFIWARLLYARTRSYLAAALLAAALLIGSTFWLDQAIQLKQYTFEVLLALIPFLVGDACLKEAIVYGKRKWILALLAIPCFLSYTYPMVLGARLLGWYVDNISRVGWRVNIKAIIVLAASVSLAIVGIWLTDYRFNIRESDSYLAYWGDCILRSTFEQGPGETLRLIAKYLWGWHGRLPFVTAVVAPLQLLGVYSVIRRLKKRDVEDGEQEWGSRSVGSLVLIVGVMLASAIVYYPICAGRLVLFVQIHLQILAIEGALFLLARWSARRAVMVFLGVCALAVLAHSGRGYFRFVMAEAAENLRPMLPMMKPEITNAVWVHPCSVAQVRSLPEGLPVERVVYGAKGRLPEQGEKAWIIWTHLGNEDCVKDFEMVRSRARSWQVIHEGPDRGLALAEF